MRIVRIVVIAVLCAFIVYPSAYATDSNTLRVDGDSFCSGGAGERTGNIFVERFARYEGFELNNSGVSGSHANEVWTKIKSEVPVPSPYKAHLLNVGFNDVRLQGNSPNIGKELSNKINNIVAFLRLSSIADDNSATYTGAWQTASSEDFYGGTLHYTNINGSSLEYVFSGSKVSIGTFVLGGVGGALEIKVDNIVKQTMNIGGQCASSYANAAIELVNLGSGTHTLEITKTDPTGTNIYIDWVGIPSDIPPKIIFSGITKMKTGSYSLYPPHDKGNDESVLDANKRIREGLSMFDEKVIFIDQSDYDPNNFNLIVSDGIHPNDFGHEWLASNIIKRW